MIPKDLLCTEDGDLDFSAKKLQLTTTLVQFVTQRLRQRLRFFLGEWFLDQRLGVPYFQRVFVSNPDIPLLTSVFRRVIIRTTGVASVEKLALRFDRSARTLFVSFEAKLIGDPAKVVFSDEPFVLETREAA